MTTYKIGVPPPSTYRVLPEPPPPPRVQLKDWSVPRDRTFRSWLRAQSHRLDAVGALALLADNPRLQGSSALPDDPAHVIGFLRSRFADRETVATATAALVEYREFIARVLGAGVEEVRQRAGPSACESAAAAHQEILAAFDRVLAIADRLRDSDARR